MIEPSGLADVLGPPNVSLSEPGPKDTTQDAQKHKPGELEKVPLSVIGDFKQNRLARLEGVQNLAVVVKR